MYYDYFGISESPFSITPDPRYLYMSKGHHEALAHLLYGVSENGGFVLLTGEVGTGKTSVCRCLLEQLPDSAEVALILNPRLTETELLAGICDELDIDYPKETASLKQLVDRLNSHLLEIHAKGQHAVVVIDEAQNLSPAVLEQVRLLTNLETTTRKLLQIILIGQPELADILRRTEMRQLAQRVTAHYHLEPLGQLETPGYIRYRLAVGGLSPELFTARAAAAVHKRSGGIPRIINSICDRCLLGAYAQDQKVIDHRLVRSASKEVFGSPQKKKKTKNFQMMRWSAVAAAAAILVLVSTPAVFGLFAKPLDWKRQVDGLLFSDSSVASAEAESTAQTQATTGTQKAAAVTRTKPAPKAGSTASQEVRAEAETAPSTAPEAESAAKPAVQAAQSQATQSGSQGTMKGATYLSSGVLVPAAAAEKTANGKTPSSGKPANGAAPAVVAPTPGATKPKTPVAETAAVTAAEPARDETSAAPQVALLPAMDQLTDPANGNSTSPAGELGRQAESLACDLPTGAGGGSQIDLAELLSDPNARQDEQSGMALLFSCWSVKFHRIDTAAPCSKATNGGLECLKGSASWRTLAQINRPAMIALAGPNGERSHAVVSAMDGTRVTLLSGDRRIETDTAAIQRYWTGESMILWRPPPVYFRLLARGARGEDVVWLKNRFAKMHGEPATTEKVVTFDSQLHARVVEFQKDRGLTTDGIVGARTLIHINAATSVPAPPVLRDTGPSAVASE